MREEIEVRPVEALVPHLLADRRIDQRVEIEFLEPDVLGHAETEVRERVPQSDVERGAVVVPQQDRHAPIQHGNAPRRLVLVERRIADGRLPQVVGDAHAGVVAVADPYQEAVVIDLERAVGRAAVRLERTGQLRAVREEFVPVERAEALAHLRQEDRASALLIGAEVERGHTERGDHGSVAIVDHASRPLEIAPLHQRDIQRHLDGLVRERTGVLPLALEPGTGTDRHRQDLLFDLGMRIGDVRRVATEQLDVGAHFGFLVQLGAEIAIAECDEREHSAGADGERLVLRVEAR